MVDWETVSKPNEERKRFSQDLKRCIEYSCFSPVAMGRQALVQQRIPLIITTSLTQYINLDDTMSKFLPIILFQNLI